MPRKSKPWAVVLSTVGGPVRTEHRSQPEAYRKVNSERDSRSLTRPDLHEPATSGFLAGP